MKTTATELLLLDAATVIASMEMQLDRAPSPCTARDVFLAAFEIIKHKENWCQGRRSCTESFMRIVPDLSPAPMEIEHWERSATVELKLRHEVTTHTRYCSAGVIGHVVGDSGASDRAREAADKVYRELTKTAMSSGCRSLEVFNDTRSHEHVVALWQTTARRHLWV